MDESEERKKTSTDAEAQKAHTVDEIADEAVEPEHDEIREHTDESYRKHVDPKGPRRPVPILTERDANTDRDRYRTEDDADDDRD